MATSLTGQTLLTPDQANAETTANELFLTDEQLGALNIKGYLVAEGSRPGNPSDFDAYIVSGTTWDALTTTTNDIVFYYQGWILVSKKHGMVANISDDAVPEIKGLISYDSAQDTWFRVQEPMWYIAAEHFTGRYFNNLFTGTVDYPIHAKAYKGTLSATTTTITHGITLNHMGASGTVAGYAYVPFCMIRDKTVSAAADIITYTLPDKNTTIQVTSSSIIIADSGGAYGTGYDYLLLFEYVKA